MIIDPYNDKIYTLVNYLYKIKIASEEYHHLGGKKLERNKLYNQFLSFMQEEDVLVDEPMKNHTSFNIGGPADILILPRSIEEIKRAIEICWEWGRPYYIMGNGTNLLVKDGGLACVVIKIANNLSDIRIEGTTITAEAGVLLSTLAKSMAKNNLRGFEFASGIPGTLGGGITMNAGAYGGEMMNVVKSCRVLDKDNRILELTNKELEFAYRKSIIQRKDYIVLEASLELEKGNYDEIIETIREFTKRRTSKQPLHLPSAGSTFRRPPGYYAGKLIEDAGLRGKTIGGAQVSQLHSGFIVNIDNAQAKDVISLIAYIQKAVKEKFGVSLEPEVRIIGEE